MSITSLINLAVLAIERGHQGCALGPTQSECGQGRHRSCQVHTPTLVTDFAIDAEELGDSWRGDAVHADLFVQVGGYQL